MLLQSLKMLYLENQLPNLHGVFTKLKLKLYRNRNAKKQITTIFDFRLILLDRITYVHVVMLFFILAYK